MNCLYRIRSLFTGPRQSPPVELPAAEIRLFALWIAFCLFLSVLLLMLPRDAHAILTIDVCGHSTWTCQENEVVGATGGASKVECDPLTADCRIKENEIKLNPKTPLDTPSGWTAPVPPAIEPTPPSTTGTQTFGYPSYTGPLNTTQAICDNMPAATIMAAPNGNLYYHNVSPAAEVIGANGLTWNQTGFCTVGGVGHTVRDAFAGCAAGYTYSGGTCTLNNPAIVLKPADGKCTIKRDGNSFSGDTRDPDCSVNPGVVVSGSTVTVSPSPTGTENLRYKFEPDGSGSITHSKPDGTGSTVEKRVVFGPPDSTTGDSPVLGTQESKYSGTGSLKGENPLGEIPTDYNRETTQQSILAELKKDRKIDETGMPTDSSLSGPDAQFNTESNNRKTALEGIANRTELGLGLSITWPVSTCNDPTFEIPGTGKSMTVPMCARRPDLQAVGNWMVAILAGFYIFTLGAGALRT